VNGLLKKKNVMKYKLFFICSLFTFLASTQSIIPVRVVTSERSSFKTLKWKYKTNTGSEILGKKKRSKGEVLYYLDTLSTMTYNVNEVETSIFGQIPNPYYIFPIVKNVKATKVVRNFRKRDYRYTVHTSENISYECNVKPKIGEIVFGINSIVKYDLVP
jgi:hypothetical protein